MNPRLLKDYQTNLYEFLVQEESLKLKVYACSQHIPTIGVGYALAEKIGGSPTRRRAQKETGALYAN
jgi:GH24 family phage-related lysozyme (muramidase)